MGLSLLQGDPQFFVKFPIPVRTCTFGLREVILFVFCLWQEKKERKKKKKKKEKEKEKQKAKQSDSDSSDWVYSLVCCHNKSEVIVNGATSLWRQRRSQKKWTTFDLPVIFF